MIWTSKPPTKEGYYWWRPEKNIVPVIKLLIWEGCHFELEPNAPNKLLVLDWGGEFVRDNDVYAWRGEWAGPIPEPEE